MKKILLLFVLLFTVGIQVAIAQTKASGKVLNGAEKNEPIIGAIIKVVGSTAGTQTDMDGNFEITLPEGSGGKLQISYSGLESQIVNAGENIEVVLSQGQNVLVDVVISTPYGPPTTKEKYVGAADVITSKKIENTPVSDITKAIEGAAPGIQVTNGGGQPGEGASIMVRGRGSLSASTAPLIVLDGAPYDGDLTSINPMDVASMNVLKDAMATSLYGARGSNGVILITTKRGKAGEKPRITVDGKVGTMVRGLPAYDVLKNASDYYEIAWRGQYNKLRTLGLSKEKAGTDASGLSSIRDAVVYQLGYNAYNLPGVGDSVADAYLLDPITGKVNPNAQLRYQDDWQSALERVGIRQDYNFNISGATEKSDYYLSAGYLNEQGYIIGTDYSRFTTRLNVSTQATDWLRAGLNISGSLSTKNSTGGGSGANTGNPTFVQMSMAPVYPVYWRDSNNNTVIDPVTGNKKLDYGNATGDPEFSMGTRANVPGNNPLGPLESNDNRNRYSNVVVVPFVEVKLAKGLSFTTRLNTSYTNNSYLGYQSMAHGIVIGRGSLTKYSENTLSYTWNKMLAYTKTIGEDHDLSLSGGHENYYFNTNYILGSIQGFANDAMREFSVATGVPTIESRTDNERMSSYYAVGSYTYKGKYLLQANIRRDGLSRFYSDARWGNFGGIGLGWIMSDEAFLKGVKWLDNLKLKASFGSNGNNAITRTDGTQNYYAWQNLYDLSRPNGTQPAAIPIALENRNLQWETQSAINAGVEFGLFNQRLNGEINVFNRQTANLYYNVPLPPSTGFPSKLMNAGSMYNRGVEVNIYAIVAKTKSFDWKINANWTKYVNRITKLADGVDSFITTSNTMFKPGYDYTSFYMVQNAGVDPTNGDELYYFTDPNTGERKVTNNFTDTANVYGRSILGNATPSFSGGITNTFTYKGLELSFLVTYSVGGKYYDATYSGLMGNALTKIGSTNLSPDIFNSWTEENPNASLPRFEWDAAQIGQVSDRFLIDASYLSLRNVNLRYTIPESLTKKAGFRTMSAYVAGDNIAFLSRRKGMNPQASFTGQVAYPYSPARTIMVGVTLGL